MKVNIFKFEYTKRMHFTQLENLALLRMEFAIGHHLVAGKLLLSILNHKTLYIF